MLCAAAVLAQLVVGIPLDAFPVALVALLLITVSYLSCDDLACRNRV